MRRGRAFVGLIPVKLPEDNARIAILVFALNIDLATECFI